MDREAPHSSGGTGHLPPAGRGRVWLVDDSPQQAELGRRTISTTHDVTVFGDGAAMLEALGSGAAPDVIVLDWHLPTVSGAETCRFVRQTRDASELPILVLTVSSASESLVDAFAAGANDYVAKPFLPEELAARVASLVQLKRMHARVAESERQLRVEARFREEFLGMLAHDLRQPLNAFTMANHVLSGRMKSEGASPFLAVQKRAADRMSRMVVELLDFTRSRPESGMPIRREVLDLGTLVRGVVQEFELSQPDRSFVVTMTGDLRGSWDNDRLAQLCSNLVGNAVEHGKQGAEILVRLERVDDLVRLSVASEGNPIPPELLPTIFDPFRRGHAAKRSSGVGLGLHIASEIVRAHSGTISARSDAAETVFEVSLPVSIEA